MSEESLLTRVLIPHRKIVVPRGKLHPSTKVFLSGSLDHKGGFLVGPELDLEMPGRDDGIDLAFSKIGLNGLSCQFDFVREILPALQFDKGEFVDTILISQALSINLRLLQLDLEWEDVNDERLTVGSCHLLFKTTGLTSRCDVGDPFEESLKMTAFFSKLPEKKNNS